MPKARDVMPRFLSVILFLLAPTVCYAGLCDITWDGDKLAEHSKNRSLGSGMRLLDKDNSVKAEVTVAQIMAFYEAKEAISRAVGKPSSFVICNNNQPNAFAMKGNDGDIVGVTVGMMKLANGDRDMAAIVIGHEYAHHVKNHASVGQANNQLIEIMGLIMGAVVEYKVQSRTGVQGLGMNLGQIGATLVSQKFSRDQEREADELGFSYMVNEGFNPKGAIRLAQRMKELGSGEIGLFFDSHPGWEERNVQFQSMIAKSSSAQQIIARTGNATTLLASQSGSGTQTLIALAPTYVTSDAQKSFNDGLALLQKNEIVGAVREFRSSAEAGYADAQVTVGYLYMHGKDGLPKNDVEAVRLFRLAADQGYEVGQFNLGTMYDAGKGVAQDYAEAVKWYRLAAAQGNASAQYNLGNMYRYGQGVAQDYAEAAKWYRLAAAQGHANAQVNLGWMYDAGKGVTQDYAEAVKWYRLAAAQGVASAQNNLGYMYLNGQGVAQDYAEAAKWYRLAAAQGNSVAQVNLGLMYRFGQGVTQDYSEAVKWFRLAAAQGHAGAQVSLGGMYRIGQGVAQDYAETLKWWRLAAAQGNVDAQFHLGVMYVTGKGVAQDYAESLKWLRLATAQGDKDAQFSLGVMYKDGYGVAQDYAEAVKWYRLAAVQGNANAQSNLGEMYDQGQGVAQDYVRAHMWLNLGAASGAANKVKSRDIVASKMTSQQIAQAQIMASDCKQKNFKGCD
jgi:TPR repeat protein